MRKIVLAVLLLIPSLAFTCDCPPQAPCPMDAGYGSLIGQHWAGTHHYCDYTHGHADSEGHMYEYHFSVECSE
jgi:hypothetical protein